MSFEIMLSTGNVLLVNYIYSIKFPLTLFSKEKSNIEIFISSFLGFHYIDCQCSSNNNQTRYFL